MVEKEERYIKAILFLLASNDAELKVHDKPRSCHQKLSSRKEASNFIQEYLMTREFVESDDYEKIVLMMEKINLPSDQFQRGSSSDADKKRLESS
ncbi:hypothetical protein N7448_004301 [Penicillium atrosanguineum]|uniref:Uncharacterized protein n=1 Tax=Penicillium atrosanguineum TaxID=1132637 RepID=A0A9W9PZN1_9EURO|nr:hypothetical protein N7448_004301 [Penicillium atrosanguineum]KAJ5316329.1 hypothetical protein N7476_006636 [Penicillium atrosanguineum]